MIRILIVDDQKVVREKLRYMLEQAEDIKVVGIATDGNLALEQIEVLQPDVVLIDIEMPNLDGINTTKIISRKYPKSKVLVLSTFDSEEYVKNSIDAGAKGYLLKSLTESELQNSVRFINKGYAQLIGPGLKKQMVTANSSRSNSSNSTAVNSRNLRLDNLESVRLNPKRQQDIDLSADAAVFAESDAIDSSIALTKSTPPKKVNWKKWLLAWAVVNFGVWVLMLLYLKSKPPVYTSEWSLILPGEANVDLNLPQAGKAKFSVDSSVEDIDPRNNILYLSTSPSVLSKAAKLANMSPDDFGEPEIELIDESSIIAFNIEGETPEEAQSKAFAIHKAMLEQIEFLKNDRAARQGEDFRAQIESEQNKLEELQQRVNQRKIKSDLIASNKVDNLAERVESLRQQKNDVERELQEANNSVQSLSSSLKLSPEQADEAVNLQGDSLFQQYLKEYSAISANLVALRSKFTNNAPVVLNEQEKLNQVETALTNRGSTILNKPINRNTLEQLNLKSSSDSRDRESMARELSAAYRTQKNLIVRNQALERQIQALNSRLQNLAREQLPLKNLEREAEFAQAILTSKIAKSGIQGDASNFPVIQLLSEPDLPEDPSSSLTASLVSTAAFSILSLTGLMLLFGDKKSAWQDDYVDTVNSDVNHNLLESKN